MIRALIALTAVATCCLGNPAMLPPNTVPQLNSVND